MKDVVVVGACCHSTSMESTDREIHR